MGSGRRGPCPPSGPFPSRRLQRARPPGTRLREHSVRPVGSRQAHAQVCWRHVTCHSPAGRPALPGLSRPGAQSSRPPSPPWREQRQSHTRAPLCRWRRPGTTCCCGRSWRRPSGLVPRPCPPSPARTPRPTARPPPRSRLRAGRRPWRLPTRGSGSWRSRWVAGGRGRAPGPFLVPVTCHGQQDLGE